MQTKEKFTNKILFILAGITTVLTAIAIYIPLQSTCKANGGNPATMIYCTPPSYRPAMYLGILALILWAFAIKGVLKSKKEQSSLTN